MPKMKIESVPTEPVKPLLTTPTQEIPAEPTQLQISAGAAPPKLTITDVPEEGWGQWSLRNIASMGKGVAQRTFGALGDVREMISGLTGVEAPQPKGAAEFPVGLGNKAIKFGFDVLGSIGSPISLAYKYAPTSEQIGKGIGTAAEYLFGVRPEYFKPKGSIEKLLHSSVKDLSTNLPFMIAGPIGIGAGITRSIMPNVAKMAVKAGGIGKTGQRATKLITQLGMGLFGNYDPKKASKAAYTAFQQKVPETARVDAKNTEKALAEINKYLKTPIVTPSKKVLVDVADELFFARSKIKHPKILDLFNSKNNLSEIIGSRKTPTKAKAFLVPLQKALKQDIRRGAAHVSKDALKTFNFAEGVLKNFHQSKQPFRFIKDKFSKSKFLTPLSAVTGALFGIATGDLATASSIAGRALGGIAGAGIGGALFKALDMAFKDPVMWKYYSQVLQKAAVQNVRQTSLAIKKFDKELKKRIPEENQ